jgi:hypothetical protein
MTKNRMQKLAVGCHNMTRCPPVPSRFGER